MGKSYERGGGTLVCGPRLDPGICREHVQEGPLVPDKVLEKYEPDQDRDEPGRWTSGGGGGGRAGDYLGAGKPVPGPESEGAAFGTPQEFEQYRVHGEQIAGRMAEAVQRGSGVDMGVGRVEQSDAVEPRGAKVEDGKLLLGMRTAQELAVARRNGRIDRDEQVDALRAAADAIADTQQYFSAETTEEDGKVNAGLNALLRDSVARNIATALEADRESTRVLRYLERPVVKVRADGKPEPARFARVRGSEGLAQVLWIAAGAPKGDDATVSAAVLKQAAKIKSVAPHLRIQRIIEDGFAHAGIKRGSPDWEEKAARARERISARLRGESLGKVCGSGEPGAPGFQEGNTCGAEEGIKTTHDDKKTAKVASNRVSSVRNKLKERFGSLVSIKSITLSDESVVTPPGGVEGERYGYYDPNENTIVLAASSESLETEQTAAPGGTAVDFSLEGAYRHEVGHGVYSKLRAVRRAEWEHIHNNLDEDFYLSGVANQNEEEFFSEAFSLYSSSDYEKGVLPKEIAQFFFELETPLSKASGEPTRPSCLDCVEKHLGAALVLMAEKRDGYEYRLRIIGHLHEAEDESQEYDTLHGAIRDARKAYQEDGKVPDWGGLSGLVGKLRKSETISGNLCRGDSGQFEACGDSGAVLRTADRTMARLEASASDIKKLKGAVEAEEAKTGGRSKAGEALGTLVAAHGRAERALSAASGALRDGKRDSSFRAWVQAEKAQEALVDSRKAALALDELGIKVGRLAGDLEESVRFAERVSDDARKLRDAAESDRKATRYAKADFEFYGVHRGDGVYVVEGVPDGMSKLLKAAVDEYGVEWSEAWEQEGASCVSFRIPGATAFEARVQTFVLDGLEKSGRSVAFSAGTLLRRISTRDEGRGIPDQVVRRARDAARGVLRAEEDADALAQGHYLGELAAALTEAWKSALIPGTAEESKRIAAEAEEESKRLVADAEALDDLRMGKNCGTGPGGFQEGNTCARGDGSSQASDVDDAISKEPTVKPSSGEERNQDPTEDKDGDGVADMARVGVAADEVPPPPKYVPRLPNLTADERAVEEQFAQAFEKDPDGVAKQYADLVKTGKIGDGPNIFNTDDAKLLSPGYNPQGKSDDEVKEARSRYNAMVHATGNAIAKKAFLSRLDELEKLPADDPRRTVLVTSGGVASGKGYALSKVAADLSSKVGAVWDAAGEQNATENPWIMKELEKRGLKGVFAFVHADPVGTWENPKRGVIERAGKKGRMVDARPFADSYAYGAKNFKAFADKHGNKAEIIYIDNSQDGKDPVRSSAMPKAALEFDAEDLYARASKILDSKSDVKPAVRRGGSVGRRIWGPSKRKAS